MIIVKNKIIKVFWFLSLFTFLKSEIVITEFFLSPIVDSQIPQYIELFNSSDTLVNLLDWSIETWVISTGGDDLFKQTNSALTTFNSSNSNAWYSGSNDGLINENLVIQPNGYFLISSNYIGGTGFFNGNNSNIEVKFVFLEVGSNDPYFEEIQGGKIIILNNSSDEIDRVEFDINTGWNIDSSNVGRSFRLHSPYLDNMDSDNWSLSPLTENSFWLYKDGENISTFGSPNEENSFRLFDIKYTDSWFDNISYVSGAIHNIYGDYNNYYRAEPYIDSNKNGIWDVGEEYHDRNANNLWDYQDNNYKIPLHFSWYGTFIDTTLQDTPNLKYEIIINKNDNVISNSSFSDLDTAISILPIDLLIDSLGLGREIANYTWEVQLTKTFDNDSIDIVYSDRYNFSIDASDYGRYGCVDNGFCNENGACPTNAYFENSYFSIHPDGCVPNVDCYSAINYYSDANINSNTCHYVSLSIPAFSEGLPNTNTPLPVYLYNDSSTVFDSIYYSIIVSDTSIVDSFFSTDISIPNIVLPTIENDTIYQKQDSLFILMNYNSNPFFDGKGIINYINFDLSDTSASTDILFYSANVKGGDPLNNISNSIAIPFVSGDLVVAQNNYRLDGRIVYYSGTDPFEIPNVELFLKKKYDGINANSIYHDTTNQYGYYNFETLKEGHYTLSFNKHDEFDLSCSADNINYYINGWDVASIAQHVTGANLLSDLGQLISADVTLDGTITGLDASFVAQYTIDLVDKLNENDTHWIFKPSADSTLSSIYADLLYDNGEYKIEYSPLVFDDENRDIYAYRLGDVNGNYCSDVKSGRENKLSNYTIKDINLSHKSELIVSVVIDNPTYIDGLYFEVGYDNEVFSPQSLTFGTKNKILQDFESMSNLNANNGSIKAIAWNPKSSQLLDGVIAEIIFHWKDKYNGGSIWLQNSIINEIPGNTGIMIFGDNIDGSFDELNIINFSIPLELYLEQNFPNPFNPSTNISWFMPSSGFITIEVYNLMGHLIDVPFIGYKGSGQHEIIWNANQYPSGIYIYYLKFGKISLKKKMILLK